MPVEFPSSPAYTRGMTHLTHTIADALRESARESDGRFGFHDLSEPEVHLDSPATYEVPVDEINVGDTLLVNGAVHPVIETWADRQDPGIRVVTVGNDYLRLDREDRVKIVRTGDEPLEESHPDFAGYCHRCGQAFMQDPSHITSHIHPRGGRDYDADENHTPYALDLHLDGDDL